MLVNRAAAGAHAEKIWLQWVRMRMPLEPMIAKWLAQNALQDGMQASANLPHRI